MRRSGYRTSAQKEGRSAGQRQRRQARERQRSLREANLYQLSVRSSIVEGSRWSDDEVGVYGVYRDDGEWVVTAMALRRSRTKMLSDRQGATKTEVVSEDIVVPRGEMVRARDGLEVERFDSKKDALQKMSAESSTRVESGEYIVRASEWRRGMKTHKVDRDEYHEWCRSRQVQTVRN